MTCAHWSVEDIGLEEDGSIIVQCSACKEIWNEGVV